LQDLSQLTQQYSHDEADLILSTAGNLFCGQVSGETARQVSERFHNEAYLKTTVSINSSDTSVSQTEQSTETVTTATLAQLSSGEFIGVVADDPGVRLERKGFHAVVKMLPAEEG
jgi:type IV secretory pathway TraG/TraD family ATPase VirD4